MLVRICNDVEKLLCRRGDEQFNSHVKSAHMLILSLGLGPDHPTVAGCAQITQYAVTATTPNVKIPAPNKRNAISRLRTSVRLFRTVSISDR